MDNFAAFDAADYPFFVMGGCAFSVSNGPAICRALGTILVASFLALLCKEAVVAHAAEAFG